MLQRGWYRDVIFPAEQHLSNHSSNLSTVVLAEIFLLQEFLKVLLNSGRQYLGQLIKGPCYTLQVIIKAALFPLILGL